MIPLRSSCENNLSSLFDSDLLRSDKASDMIIWWDILWTRVRFIKNCGH